MLHLNKSIRETHYEILSVNEDASCEEIRSSYRSAILNYHPDKLQGINQADRAEKELGERFLQVQRAWEVLGDARSRAVYDSELRAMRQDVGIGEDVNLEEMMVEDGGEGVELFYQCRCGDYFSVDSVELEKKGYVVLRNESGVGFKRPDVTEISVGAIMEETGLAGDKLILRGLKFHGFHGVKQEEKKLGQKFVIDIDAWMDLRAAGKSDRLSDTISYTEIYRIAKDVVEGPPLNLLEAVAEQISSTTLAKYPQISSVRVKVGKPHVAVHGSLDYLGVEILRYRSVDGPN